MTTYVCLAAKGAVVKTDAATAQEADALLEDILGDLDGTGAGSSSSARCPSLVEHAPGALFCQHPCQNIAPCMRTVQALKTEEPCSKATVLRTVNVTVETTKVIIELLCLPCCRQPEQRAIGPKVAAAGRLSGLPGVRSAVPAGPSGAAKAGPLGSAFRPAARAPLARSTAAGRLSIALRDAPMLDASSAGASGSLHCRFCARLRLRLSPLFFKQRSNRS